MVHVQACFKACTATTQLRTHHAIIEIKENFINYSHLVRVIHATIVLWLTCNLRIHMNKDNTTCTAVRYSLCGYVRYAYNVHINHIRCTLALIANYYLRNSHAFNCNIICHGAASLLYPHSLQKWNISNFQALKCLGEIKVIWKQRWQANYIFP